MLYLQFSVVSRITWLYKILYTLSCMIMCSRSMLSIFKTQLQHLDLTLGTKSTLKSSQFLMSSMLLLASKVQPRSRVFCFQMKSLSMYLVLGAVYLYQVPYHAFQLAFFTEHWDNMALRHRHLLSISKESVSLGSVRFSCSSIVLFDVNKSPILLGR